MQSPLINVIRRSRPKRTTDYTNITDKQVTCWQLLASRFKSVVSVKSVVLSFLWRHDVIHDIVAVNQVVRTIFKILVAIICTRGKTVLNKLCRPDGCPVRRACNREKGRLAFGTVLEKGKPVVRRGRKAMGS